MYSYCSYYDYYDYSDYDVISALVGLTGLAVIWVIALLLIALMIVAMWILFKKAGKPGWAAVVPFYDQYTLYEITWGNGWRFLMLLIPIYNIVLAILTYIRLAKAFGKDEGYAVGLVFLPQVFVPMLAFGSAAYHGWAISSPSRLPISSLSTSSPSSLLNPSSLPSLSSRRIPGSS